MDLDQLTLVQIVEYLHHCQGTKFTDFLKYDNGKKLPEDTLKNVRRGNRNSLNQTAYDVIKANGFKKCSESYHAQRRGFTLADPFFKHVIVPFFPDLDIKEPVLAEHTENPVRKFANPNQTVLEKIAANFKDGAYIYRYAFNENDCSDSELHIARGHLTVQHIANSDLSFSIEYNVVDREKATINHVEHIEGAIYLVGAFIFFVGNEGDDNYPFFMVIRHKFNGTQNGALVMRKHPEGKGYFCSRAIVVRCEPGATEQSTGSMTIEDAQGVDPIDDMLEDLINIGNNDGKGVLTLPHRLR